MWCGVLVSVLVLMLRFRVLSRLWVVCLVVVWLIFVGSGSMWCWWL